MEKIIGLDIDGCIIDFERLLRCYSELYDLLWLKKNGKVRNNTSLFKSYDWTKEERDAFKDYYLIYGTRKVPIIVGAKEVITLLKELGYKIVIITARGGMNPKTIEEVDKVLDMFGIPYDEIYYMQEDKLRIAEELGIDIMIDDNPNVVESLANNGIKSLYFRDKFSRIVEHELVTEVSNWGEILRILMDKELSDDVIRKVFPSPWDNDL